MPRSVRGWLLKIYHTEGSKLLEKWSSIQRIPILLEKRSQPNRGPHFHQGIPILGGSDFHMTAVAGGLQFGEHGLPSIKMEGCARMDSPDNYMCTDSQ